MAPWLDHVIYKLEKENEQKMHFLSKTTLFACMIIFFPSLLTNILVWEQDIHFGFFILLAYLLRPQCQALLYLFFITEQRLL